MGNIFFDARKVYSWLEDNISKNVFNMRLAYSATGDINNVVGMNPTDRNLCSDIEKFAETMKSQRHKIIYGAGVNGKAIVELLAPTNVEMFIDNYREECFIRIPIWLKSVNPEYKFSFRHYSLVSNETILYAE